MFNGNGVPNRSEVLVADTQPEMQMMKTTTTAEFINMPAFASAVEDYLKETLNQSAVGRRILTLDEAAEYCGLSLDSFKKKVVRDRIPRVRLDKRWLFDKPDLDAWIDSHKDQIAEEAAA